MNKSELRNLIREEVRNVLRNRKPNAVKEAAVTPIGKKLQKIHGEIYDYGDDGLDQVTGFMRDAKLDKVYDKWLKGDKLSSTEETKLLKAMTDALDEISNELEGPETTSSSSTKGVPDTNVDTPIGKQLKAVHTKFYKFGAPGFSFLDFVLQDRKLDKIYVKWKKGGKLTPQLEKALLAAVTHAFERY